MKKKIQQKRRTKRKFYPNLFDKRFYLPEEDRWVNLRVSAAGIRTINKKGLSNIFGLAFFIQKSADLGNTEKRRQ